MEKEQIHIEKKDYLAPMMLLIVGLLFYKPIEANLYLYLIDPLLSKVASTYLNDVIFLLLGGGVMFYACKRMGRNEYVSNRETAWVVLLFILYFRYRLPFQDRVEMTSFQVLPFIKYLDIVGLYAACTLYSKWSYREQKYKVQENAGFVFDNPIKNDGEDSIGRNKFAANLADRIKKTADQESAFAIGVASEWGNGKTSFFNLIEKHLPAEDRIIIRFNPWLNNDEKSVIRAFFQELSRTLKPVNTELSSAIIRYADLLSNVEDSKISSLAKITGGLLKKEESLDGMFRQISHAIKTSGKQIVIFIDDLDRLYESEVIEILRIIRNSANFPNTVFVVAYDRNFVINAIKKVNEHNPHKYLEKIFQLEFSLPVYEHYVIEEYLKEQIVLHLTESDKKVFETSFKGKSANYWVNTFRVDLLKSMRDVNRFVNSFLISYEHLKNEIYLVDLLNIEILKIKYLSVYDLFATNYSMFLSTTKGRTANFQEISYYILKEKPKPKPKQDTKDGDSSLTNQRQGSNSLYDFTYFNLNGDGSLLEYYLRKNLKQLGLAHAEVSDVLAHVDAVFLHTFTTQVINELSIRNPSSIDRYFHIGLLGSNISVVEFSNYRLKSYSEFSARIKEWVDSGCSKDVEMKLENITEFSNKDDLETVIRVIFDFAYLRDKDGDFSVVGFDMQNLYRKLQNDQNLSLFESKEEYVRCLLGIFKSQQSPFKFSSKFIDYIFREPESREEWKFVIPKQDLIDLNVWNFNAHADFVSKLDRVFFYLFRSCTYMDWRKAEGSNSFTQVSVESEQAKVDFKRHAEAYKVSFIKNVIAKSYHSSTPETYNYFSILKTVLRVWGSWEEFEMFIYSFDESEVQGLNEFKMFYEECKQKNYGYINWSFKNIDLSDAVLFENPD